jgi:hypothetical protein
VNDDPLHSLEHENVDEIEVPTAMSKLACTNVSSFDLVGRATVIASCIFGIRVNGCLVFGDVRGQLLPQLLNATGYIIISIDAVARNEIRLHETITHGVHVNRFFFIAAVVATPCLFYQCMHRNDIRTMLDERHIHQ